MFQTWAMLKILLLVDSERTGTLFEVRKLGIFKLLKWLISKWVENKINNKEPHMQNANKEYYQKS